MSSILDVFTGLLGGVENRDSLHHPLKGDWPNFIYKLIWRLPPITRAGTIGGCNKSGGF
jgi:hypothetical protein